MEVEKGELGIHGNPWLHREFKASKAAMGHSEQKISKQASKKEKIKHIYNRIKYQISGEDRWTIISETKTNMILENEYSFRGFTTEVRVEVNQRETRGKPKTKGELCE